MIVSYQLEAVIAAADLLRQVARGHADMHVVDLEQGLALMPMTDALFDRVTVANDQKLGFFGLPGGFVNMLAAWSGAGPIAYVEVEFFGGIGSQGAAVWNGGGLVLGPVHKAEEDPFPADGSPVSQALRRMGVVKHRGQHDEFEAVGLGRHRDHDGWLAARGVALPEAYS